MRRNEIALATLLVVVGTVWLALKAEYFSLDTSRSLKLLLVAPTPVAFVAASCVAFRRWSFRFGGSLLGIGAAAGYWSTLEPRQEWTFPLIGADPALKAVAAFFMPVGLVILFKRPVLAGFLIGLGVWLVSSVALSRLFATLFLAVVTATALSKILSIQRVSHSMLACQRYS